MINEEQLTKIRNYLVDNIFRNPNVMFSDDIQEYDLPEVICGLYEELHIAVTGKPYNYMFHWANKCGSWVDTDTFKNLVDNYDRG